MAFLKSFSFDPVNLMMFMPPNATYTESLDGLFWVPRKRGSALSSRRQPLPCTLHRSEKAPKYFVIYCHGNAMDLGDSFDWVEEFARQTGTFCLAFDYAGYGIARQTSLTPCEASVTQDVIEVYDFVRDELAWPAERVILYGQSIGSGVATACAAHAAKRKDKIMGLFLHSGYTSIRDMAVSFVGVVGNLIPNRFNNRALFRHLTCPVLLSHGDQDEVVPYHMSVALNQMYNGNPISLFHSAAGHGHNDLDVRKDIAEPFIHFMEEIERQRDTAGAQIPPPPAFTGAEVEVFVHPWNITKE
jgi:abhydrolase domain-containing protein 17